MSSIAYSLGIGSGLDTSTLIDQLAAASRTPKDSAIKARETLNTARVSSLGSAVSGIDTFATSLNALISGGTLFTQPTSSDETVLTASAIAGSRLGGLTAQLEVKQLAQAQTLVSANLAGPSAAAGQGTLTLGTAKGSFPLVIGSSDTLATLVTKINGAQAGVQASIVQDGTGARLSIKSATGTANAFTVAVDAGADANLQRFAYDLLVAGGMTRAQVAQDAILVLDGVEVTRGQNSVSDLIDGVKIDLKKAALGTTVSLGATRSTDAIRTAVGDFVSAYNELKATLDAATAAKSSDGTGGGPLRGDLGIRQMQRQLAAITSTILASGGGPQTLAEIGVSTQRDGTLTVNKTKLEAMLTSDPDGVEALFNPGQTSDNPLLKITSAAGKTKAGTYTVTNVVAADGPTPASGTIAGYSAISSGGKLIAAGASSASGLVIQPLGTVTNATITVDAGLGGALQAIRDALRATQGPLASSQTRLTAEKSKIATDRATMESREDAYKAQLMKSFTAMDTQLASFKATQSYLEQQIKLWTNDG